MKKNLLFIYFFIFGSLCSEPLLFVKNTYAVTSIDPQVSWTKKPVNMQLFARDNNDSGSVIYSGSVNTAGYISVFTELYRNEILIDMKKQTLFYINGTANFEITYRIKAELFEYKTIAYLTNDTGFQLIDIADSLVAGDVYLIMGQSNAQTADTNVTYSSEYCRTFGIQTGNTNQNSYASKDTLWAMSSAKYNGYTPLTQQQPRNVCVWGMWLQKLIKDSCSIPTCIINGAVHTSGISKHLRKNSNPTDSSTIYGKILYRVKKSGLAANIKSIFWFQGESDVVAPVYLDYSNKFDSLYKSLKTDFPGVDKIFVLQVRPLGCNGTSAFAQELRETQRKLEYTYPDIRLVSTAGVEGYTANAPSFNCHYSYTGYIEIAKILFKRVGQLYYGATDTVAIRSPNIRKAWFTDSVRSKIAMLFDNSSPASVPADSLGNSIKNYFYLNKVAGFTSGKISSVTLSGDTLFLNLNSPTTASFISYIPNIYTSNGFTIYNGPWIRNARGLTALTFDQVPILDPEPEPLNIQIKSILEGEYLSHSNQMMKDDSMTVCIRKCTFPYDIIDSAKSVLDSVSFTGLFKFYHMTPGRYYLSVKNFNTLETWSKDGGENIVNTRSTYVYDFSTAISQAYGDNLILKGDKFCIYSGDVDQNGFIDISDMVIIYNKSLLFSTENYLPEDLNGDLIVDVNDITLCYNHIFYFIGVIRP